MSGTGCTEWAPGRAGPASCSGPRGVECGLQELVVLLRRSHRNPKASLESGQVVLPPNQDSVTEERLPGGLRVRSPDQEEIGRAGQGAPGRVCLEGCKHPITLAGDLAAHL